jgi:hypothetical protein
MHVLSEYKLSALLKGGAETAHRLLDGVTQLRTSVAPERIRAGWERLLDKPRIRSLVDPHSTLSMTASTRVAIGVAIGSVVMSVAAGVHFDGALDVHVRAVPPSALSLIIDLAISWLLTATFLWIASLTVGGMPDAEEPRRVSLREFVVAVGVARVTTLIIALLSAALPRPEMLAETLLRGLLLAPVFVWFMVLLYTGFASLTGLRGRAAAIPFLAGLVTAEAITKAFSGAL